MEKGIFRKIIDFFKKGAKEFFYFLTSGIFLRNFAGMVAFLALMLLLVFGWLKCYTKHGESREVHNYIGLDLVDAIDKAEDRSFTIVVSDSMFRRDKEPNSVLDQNPKPKSEVKENRTIYLTVNKITADSVKLPDLVGGNDDFATYKRKLIRLEVDSKVEERRFNNKLAANTIIDITYKGKTITDQLKKGFYVTVGSEVGFIVSERGGGRVPIPELVCQKYDAGTFLIGNYNLNLGSAIPDGTVTDINSAYIWKQVPPYRAGKEMRIGEQIDIYLTQNRPDGCN